MTRACASVADLTDAVLSTPMPERGRLLVALAGAPGSGKSTLAKDLAQRLSDAGRATVVVPMDGFHLDNTVLDARGLRARKGAPETFDLGGFARLIAALGADGNVYCPVFDRDRDIAIAGVRHIGPECRAIIVEGNYLLLDEPGWRDLRAAWDLSIRLVVPEPVLRDRLIARWTDQAMPLAEATARAETNDLPNAARIAAHALPADLELRPG